ncbi:MAG: hypothetical protein HC858_13015 [Brachymonas sp.]|nr:hypothetical protein [Brachymonas sp.]
MTATEFPRSLPRIHFKLILIRLNRALAWGLLLSPPVQIMMGTAFWNGLVFDLMLLLIHGALSLFLFGTPRASSFRHQHLLSRLMGGQREALTGRDRFLLDSWRILISLFAPWLLAFMAYAVMLAADVAPLSGLLFLPLVSAVLYFNLLLPVSVLRHVRDASSYAYKRWRLPAEEARWLGWGTMFAFVVLSIANLFKGLWV